MLQEFRGESDGKCHVVHVIHETYAAILQSKRLLICCFTAISIVLSLGTSMMFDVRGGVVWSILQIPTHHTPSCLTRSWDYTHDAKLRLATTLFQSTNPFIGTRFTSTNPLVATGFDGGIINTSFNHTADGQFGNHGQFGSHGYHSTSDSSINNIYFTLNSHLNHYYVAEASQLNRLNQGRQGKQESMQQVEIQIKPSKEATPAAHKPAGTEPADKHQKQQDAADKEQQAAKADKTAEIILKASSSSASVSDSNAKFDRGNNHVIHGNGVRESRGSENFRSSASSPRKKPSRKASRNALLSTGNAAIDFLQSFPRALPTKQMQDTQERLRTLGGQPNRNAQPNANNNGHSGESDGLPDGLPASLNSLESESRNGGSRNGKLTVNMTNTQSGNLNRNGSAGVSKVETKNDEAKNDARLLMNADAPSNQNIIRLGKDARLRGGAIGRGIVGAMQVAVLSRSEGGSNSEGGSSGSNSGSELRSDFNFRPEGIPSGRLLSEEFQAGTGTSSHGKHQDRLGQEENLEKKPQFKVEKMKRPNISQSRKKQTLAKLMMNIDSVQNQVQDSVQNQMQNYNSMRNQMQHSTMQNSMHEGMQNQMYDGMQNGMQNQMQNSMHNGMQNQMQNSMQNSMHNGMQNQMQNSMQNGMQNQMQNSIIDIMQNQMQNGMYTQMQTSQIQNLGALLHHASGYEITRRQHVLQAKASRKQDVIQPKAPRKSETKVKESSRSENKFGTKFKDSSSSENEFETKVKESSENEFQKNAGSGGSPLPNQAIQSMLPASAQVNVPPATQALPPTSTAKVDVLPSAAATQALPATSTAQVAAPIQSNAVPTDVLSAVIPLGIVDEKIFSSESKNNNIIY